MSFLSPLPARVRKNSSKKSKNATEGSIHSFFWRFFHFFIPFFKKMNNMQKHGNYNYYKIIKTHEIRCWFWFRFSYFWWFFIIFHQQITNFYEKNQQNHQKTNLAKKVDFIEKKSYCFVDRKRFFRGFLLNCWWWEGCRLKD